MQLVQLIYLIFAIGALILCEPNEAADIANCAFEDTTNITDGIEYANGSYLYEETLIPAELIGTYDYEILYRGVRESVPMHVRGCLCKLKACVKFCCHPRQSADIDARECSTELAEELEYSPYVRVTLKSGKNELVHVLDNFAVQRGMPCQGGYMLSPQEDVDAEWELFENGTLLRNYDKAYLSRRDYCLAPHTVNNLSILNPMNCADEYEPPLSEKWNGYAMLISVPFLIATILIYLLIPQLRNLHGKCLASHLSALAVGYTILVILILRSEPFDSGICSFIGFTTYYAIMAAFFWLSVISFDLWYNFRSHRATLPAANQNKLFLMYSLYAWGLPVPLTALTILAQLSHLDESLQPGIGKDYCWLSPEGWSAMIYFYGPLLIIIVFNIVMFFLVARKIVKARTSKEKMSTQKSLFLLFLRLFIITGITWLLEIVSYIVGTEHSLTKILYVSDFCNATQGVIIFIVFVLLRRKVRKLLKQRLTCEKSETIDSNSKSAPEETALQSCA